MTWRGLSGDNFDITFLNGDPFNNGYSHPKLKSQKHVTFNYIPQILTSFFKGIPLSKKTRGSRHTSDHHCVFIPFIFGLPEGGFYIFS